MGKRSTEYRRWLQWLWAAVVIACCTFGGAGTSWADDSENQPLNLLDIRVSVQLRDDGSALVQQSVELKVSSRQDLIKLPLSVHAQDTVQIKKLSVQDGGGTVSELPQREFTLDMGFAPEKFSHQPAFAVDRQLGSPAVMVLKAVEREQSYRFTIDYVVPNAVVLHRDVAEVKMRLINKQVDLVDHVQATLGLADSLRSRLREPMKAWVEGTLDITSDVDEDNASVTVSGILVPNRAVNVWLIADKEAFTGIGQDYPKRTTDNARAQIIAQAEALTEQTRAKAARVQWAEYLWYAAVAALWGYALLRLAWLHRPYRKAAVVEEYSSRPPHTRLAELGVSGPLGALQLIQLAQRLRPRTADYSVAISHFVATGQLLFRKRSNEATIFWEKEKNPPPHHLDELGMRVLFTSAAQPLKVSRLATHAYLPGMGERANKWVKASDKAFVQAGLLRICRVDRVMMIALYAIILLATVAIVVVYTLAGGAQFRDLGFFLLGIAQLIVVVVAVPRMRRLTPAGVQLREYYRAYARWLEQHYADPKTVQDRLWWQHLAYLQAEGLAAGLVAHHCGQSPQQAERNTDHSAQHGFPVLRSLYVMEHYGCGTGKNHSYLRCCKRIGALVAMDAALAKIMGMRKLVLMALNSKR